MHLVLPLLAFSVACVGGLSHRLGGSLAVSYSGNRRARRFGVFEGPLFTTCTAAARTASDLTDNLRVCTKVTSPRLSKKHRFWLLNRSFLNSLRMFAGPPSLWKPCGNRFSQKNRATDQAMKKSARRPGLVHILLNIKELIGSRAPAQVVSLG